MKAIGLIYNMHGIPRDSALAFGKTLSLKPEQVLGTENANAEDVKVLWEPEPSTETSVFDRVFGRSF